jgi:hypothetical protein
MVVGQRPNWVDVCVGLILAVGGLMVLAGREAAALWVVPGLVAALGPLARAWRGSRGTALRSAVLWGAAAVGAGLVAQACAGIEPLGSGRPWAGHATYLSALATLAALVSVLNARKPGAAVWAILMGVLVLVFLIPWLEGDVLARRARGLSRLRLVSPWTVFYGLLVLAGVTNYAPTRYGPAVAVLAAGFAAEYVALTRVDVAIERRGLLWSVFPWTLAVAIRVAHGCARREPAGQCGLERTWTWFRDHWGVVWALRVQERFNRTAETLRWPIRLGWYGVVPAPDADADAGGAAPELPDAAEPALRGLLRRFADPGRIDRAIGRG